jgi:hypothetical protein
MILLDEGTLFFATPGGETLPLKADMIQIEISSQDASFKELVDNAIVAVFHYFKHDLGRTVVTFGEFSLALEQVLRTLGVNAEVVCEETPDGNEIDLRRIAGRSYMNELVFFTQLRPAIRSAMEAVKPGAGDPVFLRFRGLRQCIKMICGVTRWNARCAELQREILEYINASVVAEAHGRRCILMVG